MKITQIYNIRTHNKNTDKFLKDLSKTLFEHNVLFRMSLDKYVDWSGSKSNGFFEGGTKNRGILACAFGSKKWLRTLVHESCHFDQWREKSKYWTALTVGRSDACTLLFNWVENKKIKRSKNVIAKYAEIVRDLELDCERRAIVKIKKYNLPIDVKRYCKEAGAYVLFYNYIKEYRKWYIIGKEPYNNEMILALMPTNLDYNFSENSEWLNTLYKRCVTK